MGFETPGNRASVLVFSEERAAATGTSTETSNAKCSKRAVRRLRLRISLTKRRKAPSVSFRNTADRRASSRLSFLPPADETNTFYLLLPTSHSNLRLSPLFWRNRSLSFRHNPSSTVSASPKDDFFGLCGFQGLRKKTSSYVGLLNPVPLRQQTSHVILDHPNTFGVLNSLVLPVHNGVSCSSYTESLL